MAIDPNFLEMEWQNGFEATLDARVVLTDEYIPMTPVPEGDFGRLVLEDTSKENFEIIRYNRKDATGVFVEVADGGLRNEDGSSSGVHPRGARIRGNITAQDIREMRAATKAAVDEFTAFVANLPDWRPIAFTPGAVRALGGRQYEVDFPGNLTSSISAGMNFRTTRNVNAPTTALALNGTTQSVSKNAPNKMTYTDDHAISAWIKLESYSSTPSTIVSRYNGTNGFRFRVEQTGQLRLLSYNGSSGNWSDVLSVRSIVLNRWVHVVVQQDMSAFTATPTTSYMMIDGKDVPVTVSRGGSNPTSFIQAGNLEIGASSNNTEMWFAGKIAQVAIFNTKITQATMASYYSQGLIGNEPGLVSAYSFNNSLADLNTTTPNDLTLINAPGYVAQSPFGTQGNLTVDPKLDYGRVLSVAFAAGVTTVRVLVPDACTIPTIGGLSAAHYSNNARPYGFPLDKRFLVYNYMRRAFAGPGEYVFATFAKFDISCIPAGARVTLAIDAFGADATNKSIGTSLVHDFYNTAGRNFAAYHNANSNTMTIEKVAGVDEVLFEGGGNVTNMNITATLIQEDF